MPEPAATISSAEAARRIGVCRQRVDQLRKAGRLTQAGYIPRPGAGTGWQVTAASVAEYLNGRSDRKGGRPIRKPEPSGK